MPTVARRPVTPDEIANPPEGKRLELLGLASHLGVTIAALADAAGISRSSMSRIATGNTWPSSYDREQLKAKVLAHLTEAGATPRQLAIAFHAHVHRHAWEPGVFERRTTYQARAAEEERLHREQLQTRGRRPSNGRPNPTQDDTEGQADMLIAKQTLTPEARRAFKLFANPFDGEVTTDAQMFTGGEVAYIREAVWQCAKTGSFVALVGESGCGKTTVVSDLEARIDADKADFITIRPSVLGMEGNDRRGKALKSSDILAAVIAALDPAATIPQTLDARTRKAERLLGASAQAGNAHLLVIEEAHSLPDATLKHLKRLHEIRAGRRPLLGILLVAQPELAMTLRQGLLGGHLREVAQRIEVVQFLPLDADLGPYLAHRAKAAGRALDDFITADGIEALRARLTKVDASAPKKRAISLCYALTVNNWMTRLLNEAASLGVPCINRDVVAAA